LVYGIDALDAYSIAVGYLTVGWFVGTAILIGQVVVVQTLEALRRVVSVVLDTEWYGEDTSVVGKGVVGQTGGTVTLELVCQAVVGEY